MSDTSCIRPAVEERFVAFSTPLEGCVPHFYLDIKGLVTIAIGRLADPLSTALDLPLVRADGSAATQAEIEAEWRRIKPATWLARKGHTAARSLCVLHLTPEGIESVTMGRLREMGAALARRFPDFPCWPADAQLAVLSLSWACGPGFAFPKCAAALALGDFTTAARECAISSRGNPGVIPRNVANRRLLTAAALVVAEDGDRDVLTGVV